MVQLLHVNEFLDAYIHDTLWYNQDLVLKINASNSWQDMDGP